MVGVPIILLFTYLFYSDLQSQKAYKERNKGSDKVSIVVQHAVSGCSNEYPYFYYITNGSDRVVTNVQFSVEVRKKGFSTVLNWSNELNEDKILKPGEGYGRCFEVAMKSDYRELDEERDIDINVGRKYVTFFD